MKEKSTAFGLLIVLSMVFSTVGRASCYFWVSPWYWTPLTALMISSTCIIISPHGTQLAKDGIPTVLNTPPPPPTALMIPPRASWYAATVLSSPTILKISSHCTEHPHGTEHTVYRVITLWKRMITHTSTVETLLRMVSDTGKIFPLHNI